MFARPASPAAHGRHRAAPRRTPLLQATAGAAATAVVLATVAVADSAAATPALVASGADAAQCSADQGTFGTAQIDPAVSADSSLAGAESLVPQPGATVSSHPSQTGTCIPSLTLEQGPGQDDPTLHRDLRFRLTSSVPLDPSSITASDFTLAATATAETTDAARLNPRVESATAVPDTDGTAYDIVVRVDDSATVSLSLGTGEVATVTGVTSTAPASSQDGQITFVNPVGVAPAAVSVTTGSTGEDYTLALEPGAPAPSAPLDFVASLDQVGTDHGLTLSTPTPTIAAGATTSAPVTVTAPAAQVAPGTAATIAHTLTSADPGYDGLVVPPFHLHLVPDDPTIRITKQAYVDVADATSAATITATGTRAPAGARLVDGQAVCFVYTVTNTSVDGSASTLTDITVTDSDKRLGSAGLIGTIAELGVGRSTQVSACTSLVDDDTTAP